MVFFLSYRQSYSPIKHYLRLQTLRLLQSKPPRFRSTPPSQSQPHLSPYKLHVNIHHHPIAKDHPLPTIWEVIRITARSCRNAWGGRRHTQDEMISQGAHSTHTYAIRLRAAGVSHEDRQDLLEHSNGSMTTHYSHTEIRI